MQDKYTAPAPARSALLTIDVQHDFTNPGTPAEISGTSACLPAMGRVVAAYRQHRLPIVHVVRLYLADGSNADPCRREMLEQGKAIVLAGSPGAELVDPLKPGGDVRLDANALLAGSLQTLAKNEWAMYKPRWDAFYQTPLEQHLHDLGVNTVVVVGCNFPNCPRATVYGASMRDFRVALIPDAVSGVYERGLEELSGIGVATPSSEELVRQLQG
jgi:nicotinamidase-related amidase